jgi:hypothetical protein
MTENHIPYPVRVDASPEPSASRGGWQVADPMRSTSRVAGVLYLLTFVSIPTLALYQPVKDHADFILGVGSGTGLLWGALSEVVVGLAGIGTAVVLFPVLKRQSESAALGILAARILETCLIFFGVISLLSIITLRNDVAGHPAADPASLVTTAHSQIAMYNGTFLLSQSLMPVIVDVLLGYLLYRSRLVVLSTDVRNARRGWVTKRRPPSGVGLVQESDPQGGLQCPMLTRF